jgi:hypothetical protein
MQDAVDQLQAAAENVKDSIEVIRQQTFQSQRPSVGVEVIVSPGTFFHFDGSRGGAIDLQYTLKNSGHSIAQNARIWGAVALNDDWPEVHKSTCAAPPRDVGYGYLILPDQPISGDMVASVSAEYVKKVEKRDEEARSHHPSNTPRLPSVGSAQVVICVDYRSTIESRRHHTEIVRNIKYLGGPDLSPDGGVFGDNMRYPPKDIKLAPLVTGGDDRAD